MNVFPQQLKHRRGFSLTELVVTLAMIGVLTAVAVPSIQSMARASVLGQTARTLTGDLQRARGMVTTGRQNFTGWTNDDRTEHAGLRFLNASEYVVFVDRDTQANGAASEVIVETRTIETPVQVANGPAEIRFRRNGTLSGVASDLQIQLTNTESGTTRTIRIAFGGKADIIQ